MAVIAPFKGIHYNTEKLKNLADVITPPYDVIPKGGEQAYFSRSPYNFAHVILPKKPDDDYTDAASIVKKWRELQILKQDGLPCYYLYRQNFQVEGKSHTRDTLMCTVQLHDFKDGIVRPHENTHGKYKADRLQILRKTQCNLSHIFGMVKDPEGFLESAYEKWEYRDPILRATDEFGVEHAVWRIEGAKATDITSFFADKSIYIVDGHHRYESSLQYARETGALNDPANPASHMLFAIANASDPGLVVFPTHRFVTGVETRIPLAKVEETFTLSPLTYEALRDFVKTPKTTPQFGLYVEGKLYLCAPKHWAKAADAWGKSVSKLSVAWSDHGFLKEFCGINDTNRTQRIQYERALEPLWERKREANAIVFHAPPFIDDVLGVADEEKFMPQKSTFFYPKLAAGLIMRDVAYLR